MSVWSRLSVLILTVLCLPKLLLVSETQTLSPVASVVFKTLSSCQDLEMNFLNQLRLLHPTVLGQQADYAQWKR